MREFQRFNTVCTNAYVQPLMASYLQRLKGGLQSIGVHARLFIMPSGVGIVTIDSAIAFPVCLLESGPAGGAIFAADIAMRHGLNRVLSYDMGGTRTATLTVEHIDRLRELLADTACRPRTGCKMVCAVALNDQRLAFEIFAFGEPMGGC
jgi:N-methylhydantoinase A/oxoprolinase/acetone carboxylase beta subunit